MQWYNDAMKGAPVRLRGPQKSQRPVPSTLFADPTQVMQMMQKMFEMYQTLEDGIKRMDEVHARFKDLKVPQEPASAQEVAQILKAHVPSKETIVAALKAYLPAVPTVEQVSATIARSIPVPVADPAQVAREVVKLMPEVKAKRGKKGRDGKDAAVPSKEELVDHLFEQLTAGKRKISLEHVAGFKEGMEQTLGPIRSLAAGFRGGGDTVVAGAGVTITNTVNGNKQISAAGGGSSSANEKVAPTQAGSNVTLNLATLSHAFSSILGVYKNGQLIDQTDVAFGWSRTGNIITVLNGFDTDVYYVAYTYA